MGHYLLSVGGSFDYIEPCVLGPLLTRVDEAKELDTGRDILEDLFSATLELSLGVRMCSVIDGDEAPASLSCFLSATLCTLDEIRLFSK